YDPAGNRTAVTNALGYGTRYDYDARNRLVRVTDPALVVTSYGYDPAGRLKWASAANNTSYTEYRYDAAGRLEATVDPRGNRTTTVYDAAGNAEAVVDALNRRTTAVYDALNRPVVTIDPLLHRSTAVYDAAGQLEVAIDAAGRRTTAVYDAAGRVAAVVDPLGQRTTTVYDDAGRAIATVDPLGNRSTTVYDDAGRAIATVDPRGNRTTAVYDAAGNVEAVVDPFGKRTTAVYDALNRPVETVDPLGNRSTVVYDPNGNAVAAVDPAGVRVTTTYDALDRPVGTVDPLGNRTTTAYDPAGRVSQEWDGAGRVTTYFSDALGRVYLRINNTAHNPGQTRYEFDQVGNLKSVNRSGSVTRYEYDQLDRLRAEIKVDGLQADPLRNRTAFAYDEVGNVVAVTDPRGNTTTTTYDALNRAVGTLDPLQNRTTTAYDAAGRVERWVDARGFTTTALYDEAGNRTTTIDPLGGRTTVVYDALGRAVEVADPLGHRTTVVYDAAGDRIATVDAVGARTTTVYVARRAVNTIDPLGKVTTYTYDGAGRVRAVTDSTNATTTYAYSTYAVEGFGRVEAVTDPTNSTTTYTYDLAGRLAVVTDPLGKRTTTLYDGAGNVPSVTDARGQWTYYSYDGLNRPRAVRDPLNNVTTTTYDDAANVTVVTDPLGRRTTTAYDARNRPVRVTAPDGGVWTTVYDAAGNAVARVDPLGHRTTTAYDALGRAVAETDARGFATTTAYDAAGRVTSVTDADGNVTSYAYDAAGRVAAETDPLGATATYSYNARGDRTGATDRSGRRREWTYDDAGRPTTETWRTAAGALVQTQTFAYDPAGRLTVAADPDGTYTLAYDAAGRVRRVDEPFGLTLTFGYDAAGNRTSVQDSRGGLATIAFDVVNRQTAEELGGTGVTRTRVTREYDAAGELTTVTRDVWGGSSYALAGTSTYAYDPAGRVGGITHRNASGTALATYAYAYDTAGRLTAKTDGGVTTSYAYDAADQLTTAGAATYSYDPTGDRTNPGYATGAGNRTTTDGVWTYTYDADGRVAKRSQGAAAETWVYAYDHRGQLTTATRSATDGGSATGVATYAYDAWGNLISRQAWDGSTTTTERYGLDGWDPAKPGAVGNESFDAWADLDGSGTLTARRGFGPGFDAPTVKVDGSGTASFYLADHLGSVRAVTNSSGTVTGTAAYDAFGNLAAGARADRYGYTGTAWDALVGLQRNGNGARWYDPAAGRWLQPDPLGFDAGDINLYRYVGNQPTGAADPSGLDTLKIVGNDVLWESRDPLFSAYVFRDPHNIRIGTLVNGNEIVVDNPDFPRAFNKRLPLRSVEAQALRVYTDVSGRERWIYPRIDGLLLAAAPQAAIRPLPGPPVEPSRGPDNPVQSLVEPFLNIALGLVDDTRSVLDPNYRKELNPHYREFLAGRITREQLEQKIKEDIFRAQMDLLMGIGPAAIERRMFGGRLACPRVPDEPRQLPRPRAEGGTPARPAVEPPIGSPPNPGSIPLPVVEAPRPAPSFFGRILGFMRSQCFVPGTPLLTPVGSRPIESFRPGDLLLSRPEGKPDAPPALKAVEEVFETEGRTTRLRVSGHLIETTDEHPFYVVGRGWLAAAKLVPGDVLASHNETLGVVEEVVSTGAVKPVYNLRVADWHTYFVGGDDWGFSVWAHNSCSEFVEIVTRTGVSPEAARVQYNRLLRNAGSDPAAQEAAIRAYLSKKLPPGEVEAAVRASLAPPSPVQPGTVSAQARLNNANGTAFENNLASRIDERGHVTFFQTPRRGGIDVASLENGNVVINEAKFVTPPNRLQTSDFTAINANLRSNLQELLNHAKNPALTPELSAADRTLVVSAIESYLKTGVAPANLRIRVTVSSPGGTIGDVLGPNVRNSVTNNAGGIPTEFVEFRGN
ncbi:hypothetical protein J0H58_02475, partial [bacterium]|nr:hypothetical protein [bacterium]